MQEGAQLLKLTTKVYKEKSSFVVSPMPIVQKQPPSDSDQRRMYKEKTSSEIPPIQQVTKHNANEHKLIRVEDEDEIREAENKLLQSLSDLEDDDPVFSSLIGRNDIPDLPIIYSPTRHPIEKHKVQRSGESSEPWEIKEVGQGKSRGCSGAELNDVCIIC